MKTSIKFATGLILAAAALVASGSAAHAGEGGAAGSVSIVFGAVSTGPAPDVVRLSTSVAVGKNYGAAVARTAGVNTNTSAGGAGGALTLDNANDSTAAYSTTLESASGIILNQANNFTGVGGTKLAPTTGVTLAD
jgi:hypothetical protein